MNKQAIEKSKLTRRIKRLEKHDPHGDLSCVKIIREWVGSGMDVNKAWERLGATLRECPSYPEGYTPPSYQDALTLDAGLVTFADEFQDQMRRLNLVEFNCIGHLVYLLGYTENRQLKYRIGTSEELLAFSRERKAAIGS